MSGDRDARVINGHCLGGGRDATVSIVGQPIGAGVVAVAVVAGDGVGYALRLTALARLPKMSVRRGDA